MPKLFAAFAVLVPVLSGCARQNQRHVVVVFPEHWGTEGTRNCNLLPVGSDVLNKGLPVLDCDSDAHDVPRSRIFVMDVSFDGSNPQAERWTCHLGKDVMA